MIKFLGFLGRLVGYWAVASLLFSLGAYLFYWAYLIRVSGFVKHLGPFQYKRVWLDHVSVAFACTWYPVPSTMLKMVLEQAN